CQISPLEEVYSASVSYLRLIYNISYAILTPLCVRKGAEINSLQLRGRSSSIVMLLHKSSGIGVGYGNLLLLMELMSGFVSFISRMVNCCQTPSVPYHLWTLSS